mmetsp:Transcript_56572/g.136804  ORF Transcript_56572/g.136804 Transcript_56572/m.136804 type:complete len:211 (-) Transcript_56572:261-893(-)
MTLAGQSPFFSPLTLHSRSALSLGDPPHFIPRLASAALSLSPPIARRSSSVLTLSTLMSSCSTSGFAASAGGAAAAAGAASAFSAGAASAFCAVAADAFSAAAASAFFCSAPFFPFAFLPSGFSSRPFAAAGAFFEAPLPLAGGWSVSEAPEEESSSSPKREESFFEASKSCFLLSSSACFFSSFIFFSSSIPLSTPSLTSSASIPAVAT